MRTQLLTLDQLVQLLDPQLYLHLQKADSTNFFFFFRMLLVWYKREFEWMDVLRLWEGLWTDYMSSNFHLFIAVAILEKHRDVIMNHLQHFDEVLKYSKLILYCVACFGTLALNSDVVNDLSNTIDLQSTLIRAEALFRRFQRTVEAIDKKNNFPVPSVRQRRPVSGEGANGSTEATTSGSSPSAAVPPARPGSPGADKAMVISPELRKLLSRQVEVMDSKEIKQHGGGVGS